MMEEDGWPLGLQLMNARARNVAIDFTTSSSSSFSTLFTSIDLSSTSSSFSSQSTKTTYYYDRRRRGVTLQSLLNTPTTQQLSITCSSSSSPSSQQPEIREMKKNQAIHKPKSWFLSLCSNPADRDHNNDEMTKEARLSLGYLLEQERVRSIRT